MSTEYRIYRLFRRGWRLEEIFYGRREMEAKLSVLRERHPDTLFRTDAVEAEKREKGDGG